MLRTLVFIGCAAILATSCGKKTGVKNIPAAPVRMVQPGDTERGIASWYGAPYHGRAAANGELYNMHDMTAAHRTMPFGTWVEVENETNRRKVQVRITDRGPFVNNRIIDVSRRAAEQLDMIGPGTAPVKLLVIEPPKGAVKERYGVQVSAWAERSKAEEQKARLEKAGYRVRITEKEGEPVFYRVIAGEGTREEADALRQQLRQKGYRGIVVRHVP